MPQLFGRFFWWNEEWSPLVRRKQALCWRWTVDGAGSWCEPSAGAGSPAACPACESTPQKTQNHGVGHGAMGESSWIPWGASLPDQGPEQQKWTPGTRKCLRLQSLVAKYHLTIIWLPLCGYSISCFLKKKKKMGSVGVLCYQRVFGHICFLLWKITHVSHKN